ncbi:hypothetical protein [Spirosoma arboris]|uniref:hypothetical protein n=1 Tax=Spirosoma arboris TaxID=2682092 RepID=UPI001D123A9C|nr:hypothetical protein [Spirosoma arboris]
MKILLKSTDFQRAIVATILLIFTSIMTTWAQCSVSSPNGSVDYANCNSVGGWAFNGANLNQPVIIDIYVDGVKTYSGITANGDRQDLVTAFGSSAARYHGFSYSFPATAPWKNGQNHAISVRICGANSDIGGSPKTVSGCTGGTQPPVSTGNCPYTEGQFLFTTSWGESVYAHYYNGSLFAAYQDGGNFRPQHWLVATGLMASSTASCFAENDPHTTTTPTPPTTTTTTTPTTPAGANLAGNLDGAECTGIGGWVMNRNATNQSTKFDVYINGQLAASNVLASNSRQDVSNAFGVSGYNAFGFSWSIPAQYKNGSALSISVRYADTTTDIPGSPKTTAACQGSGNPTTPTTTNPTTSPAQAGSNFAGNLDGADCSGIGGWVVNKNTPQQSTKFDVYINGWLVAVGVPATNSRQDVANALGISGYNAFGFYMPLPAKYKTGSAMTISVKYSGTQTNIPGSPKTTAACLINPLGCNGDGAARVAYAESITHTHSGGVALQVGKGGSSRVSSLTSKLIPVRQGSTYSLDVYAYTPSIQRPSLAPQITAAVAGGALAGASLLQQPTAPDQRSSLSQKVPILGVSTSLIAPLVKSLITKRLPRSSMELAFYNQYGKFIYRQQIDISKDARSAWQLLHIEGYTQETGYVAVRLQNLSKTPVWFDDISFHTVQLPRSSSVNKGLFVPKTTTSISAFAPQQSINTESLYRNCTQEAPVDGGWLNVDVTVRGYSNDGSVNWGWISGPDSGSIIGPVGSTGGGSGGSSSTATFVPYNAPKDTVATGVSTTGTLTKGQVYNSPTGATYIWDGKSWCIAIAEVEVKGKRPTNPTNEQFYFYTDPDFGYTTVYEYISGRWTMPMVNFDVNSLPKPKFLSEPLCKTLNNIWRQSFDINGDPMIENMLLVTDKGTLVLPTSGQDCSGTYHANKVNESWPEYYGDFITLMDGNGNKSTALDLCDGTRVIIYSAIHTHPSTAIGNPLQPSPGDINFARSNPGVNTYILANDGLWNYDTDGHLNLNESRSQLNNCN